MSWDIFVQDLPAGAARIEDISPDFSPKPFLSRARIEDVFREVFPLTDFSDPRWWRVECPAFHIEVNIDPEDPSNGFALHVRGGEEAVQFVAKILNRLGVRALDPSAKTGFFSLVESEAGFRKWRYYLGKVVNEQKGGNGQS